MFDVGFSELILLAIVALVVLGPEKLPHAARILGAWVGRIRRTVSQVQAEIEREVATQEMKARMEKAFGASEGKKLLDELQAEQQQMDSELKNLSQAASSALSEPDSAPQMTATPTVATPAAIGPVVQTTSLDEAAAPLLPNAAQSPDTVVLDGEAAYREWLASQRTTTPVIPASSVDTPHS
jgi:sec-independent protein translocase protein TatB